jgi:hypothetical protein
MAPKRSAELLSKILRTRSLDMPFSEDVHVRSALLRHEFSVVNHELDVNESAVHIK